MLKLSNENKKFMKIILDGFFRIYFAKLFSKFKPKKYRAYSKYAIVSAIYNVEKYLDDYFKSIINQRLDFKNNIFIICVDDGSTDKSASVIKKYQKKYPKNIIYLYKKNGGQASARNLALRYLKENDLGISWVSFTDPDDFLDRDYFYEMDKNIKKYKDDDICMLSCNVIFYFEKFKTYRDNHPLNYKYKNHCTILKNKELNHFIQLSAASVILKFNLLSVLFFNEDLKPNFEDASFVNEYLLQNLDKKSIFLKNARYFYRKRKDRNSALDGKNKIKDYYLVVPKLGYLKLLKDAKTPIPNFIQNVVLYDLCWCIKELLDSHAKIQILSHMEKKEFKAILFEIFSYIDVLTIKNFKNNSFDYRITRGVLNYFKNEVCSENVAFIESIDDKNDEILVKYYFNDKAHVNEIFLDDKKIDTQYSKIRQYDLLDEIFLYERRMWIKIKNDSKILSVYINSQKLKLIFNDRFIVNLSKVLKTLKRQKKQRAKNTNLWLFADMSWRADDNAEHLYRYVMQNYPEQKIVFALQKKSHDYERLKKEGFKLVDPKSLKFKSLLHRADKVVSSHIDRYIFNAFGGDTLKTKDFVFLQHGITKDDLSSWLNQRKIDLFITGMQDEYDSIAGDFNRYKFTPKEVKLTGFPRWDALLKNNQIDTKQILIMPTWREYIVGSYSKKLMKRRFNPKFYESEYFYRWGSFLHSKKLQELHEKHNYKIVFNPHPQIRPYLEGFNLPNYIAIPSVDMSIQKLFCESSLMITDYSSVAFEMAILKKPVIYYQFDKDELFSRHIYAQGYFDYDKDGFGIVVLDIDNLLYELKMRLQNHSFKNNFLTPKANSLEKVMQSILSI